MGKRSGSEQRRLNRTVTSRWDDEVHGKLINLAKENGRSVGRVLRSLVIRADYNLPRTQELSRELIRIRSSLNLIAASVDDWDEALASELRAKLGAIEGVLRDLRS